MQILHLFIYYFKFYYFKKGKDCSFLVLHVQVKSRMDWKINKFSRICKRDEDSGQTIAPNKVESQMNIGEYRES